MPERHHLIIGAAGEVRPARWRILLANNNKGLRGRCCRDKGLESSDTRIMLITSTPITPSASGAVERRVEQSDGAQSSPGLSARTISASSILCLDTEYRYLFCNDEHRNAVRKAWGAEVSIGSSMLALIPSLEERALVRSNLDKALKGETTVNTTHYGDLDDIWESVCSPMFNGEGKISGVSVTSADVTEQRRLEDALLEREHKYQYLFDNMTDGFVICKIICDEQGVPCNYRILEANKAYEAQTGIAISDIVGKTVLEALPDIEESWIKIYGEIALTHVSRSFELYNHSTRRYYQTTAFSLYNGQFARVFKDITDQKLSEVALKRSEESQRFGEHAREREKEVAHLDRLNTMGEMATGLAHELNQPLAAIATYADVALRMLDAEVTQPEKLREIITGARQQALRASEIIRHLRRLVKKQTVGRVKTDINHLIESVVTLLAADLQLRGVDLHLKLSENLPSLMLDDVQIEQVIINLLRNALEVEVDVGAKMREVTIRSYLASNSLVRVEVTDNGSGMEPEVSSQIFNAFYSTKGGQGMGMGLSISRSIIEAHDGRLWANSEWGQGSTLSFSLPVLNV